MSSRFNIVSSLLAPAADHDGHVLHVWVSLDTGDEFEVVVDYYEQTSSVVSVLDARGDELERRHWTAVDVLEVQQWAAHSTEVRALYDAEILQLRECAAAEEE